MRRFATALVILLLLSEHWARPAPPAKRQMGAVRIGGYQKATLYRDRMELTGGRPSVKAEDGSFRLDADRIVVVTGPSKDGRANIQSASAEGSVALMARPEPGQLVDATAAKAEYSAARDDVVLTGKVRVVVTDPRRFAEPAVLVGEKATFNLHPKEDQWRIQVEGAPGQSELTVTPRPQEK